MPRCHSGNLIRMEPDGGKQEVFANTGGRVLGFDFDAQGRMIAADAMKGLLAITSDRRVTVLTDRVSRRRSHPLCRRRRRGTGRDNLFHRRVDALCSCAMGRHIPGERARHHGAIRHGACARP